jgi:aminoglycoside phosphotransferase (APT) family kinase protein
VVDDRQQAFSGTQEVQPRHRFDERRLEAWLRAHVPGFRGPLEVREFRGGQSNPTYQLETPDHRYALRRKPPGTLLPSAHAVDREFRVLHALQGSGVPVPRTLALCTDEAVIGTWFYVMDCVEGRVIWNDLLPDFAPDERRSLWLSLVDALAALHRVDCRAVGLADFGRPGNYFARQIARWTKQYQASETEKIPAMDRLIEWLPRSIPPGDESVIIHGDFKLDNVVLHPSEPRVVAVLDWELSTIGRPFGDFTYLCTPWWREGGFDELPGRAGLGIPSRDEMAAAYCARSGREAPASWDWYVAYNLFRGAGILQGIRGRVRDGTAASEHAREISSRVAPMAERAWEIARKLGA